MTEPSLRAAAIASLASTLSHAVALVDEVAARVECPACKGRMKLVAVVTEPRNGAQEPFGVLAEGHACVVDAEGAHGVAR
ncbi:MAG TPA: hypothetical protein VL242_11405 [Sorangium sp.]|nr:hypothetical protein [Sorangium sp.]